MVPTMPHKKQKAIMDRNKKYVFTAIIALLTATACFDDAGNYDYLTLNGIYVDTVGVQTSFSRSQFDSLVITPDIKFSETRIDDSNLIYKWILYPDKFVNEPSGAEVLSTERNLRTVITQKPQTDSYAIILYITNKQNNTVYQAKYSLTVLASVISGWLVMHADGNESDLDYIATTYSVPGLEENRRMKNVYSAMNGRKIEGNPIFVSTVRNNVTILDYVYIGSDREFLMLSGKDFSLLHKNGEMFKNPVAKILPQFVGHGSRYGVHHTTILINDGKVHNINNQASPYWIYAFSNALPNSNSLVGEVKVAPYVYFSEIASGFTNHTGIFYDTAGKRFVRLPYSIWEEEPLLPFAEQVTTGRFDVNNIGKDLIYFENGYEADGFALFTDGESRELYRIKFNITTFLDFEHTNEENPEIHNLARTIYNMSALPEIYDAGFYACGSRGYYFYYATERNIYTYSYAGSKQATLVNDPFPDDEKITGMKLYNTGSWSTLRDVSGTIMYVSTWNGKEGKLYEFAINTSSGAFYNKNEVNGVIDRKAPLNVFDGFGKIIDMSVKIEGYE
jgi:hypothetical protein